MARKMNHLHHVLRKANRYFDSLTPPEPLYDLFDSLDEHELFNLKLEDYG